MSIINSGKIGIGVFVNNISDVGLVGLLGGFGMLHSNPVGEYRDPNSIGGATYNPEDWINGVRVNGVRVIDFRGAMFRSMPLAPLIRDPIDSRGSEGG